MTKEPTVLSLLNVWGYAPLWYPDMQQAKPCEVQQLYVKTVATLISLPIHPERS